MRSRIALVLTLATVYALSLRVTGQAPGGAQGVHRLPLTGPLTLQ